MQRQECLAPYSQADSCARPLNGLLHAGRSTLFWLGALCAPSIGIMAGLASLLPASLYGAGPAGLPQHGSFLDRFLGREQPALPLAPPRAAAGLAQPLAHGSGSLMLAAPSEKPKIEMYSAEFYRACTIGGILS